MPTYEYECKSCGYNFETFQSMSAAPLRDCPECGGEVRRLINGGGGIIFKGSGFYVTDKSGGKAAAKTAAPGEKPAGKAPAGEKPAGEKPADKAPAAAPGGTRPESKAGAG